VSGSARICGFAKRSVERMEDLVSRDFVYMTVDCVGFACVLLTISTSFLPGLNLMSHLLELFLFQMDISSSDTIGKKQCLILKLIHMKNLPIF